MTKYILIGLIFSLWCGGGISDLYAQQQALPIQTLIIDPGHGGKDPGAVGKNKYEKDIALKVAKYLRDTLQTYYRQMNIVLTRETDTFIPLHERGRIAQDAKGDFFISIHCNAMKQKDRQGAETYVLGVNKGQEGYETVIKENQAMLFEENHADVYGGFDPHSPEGLIYLQVLKDVFRSESLQMAQRLQNNYRENLGRIDRGVKQAPFVVLYMSGMPAVLTEIGFISNLKEESYLAKDTGQKEIAYAIFDAIRGYQEALQMQQIRGDK
ncbi:MAG: N-acetylmuramoyl-L-alanine amidase [Bacteroidota bacterium]